MGFQVATLSQLVTVSSVTATSTASGFPIARTVAKHPPFVRGWRSTDLTTQTLDFTFASTTIVAALLYDCNFTTVTVAGSARTVTADDFDSIRTPRYKLWVPLSLSGQTTQSVVIPNQATTDGAAYFSVGKVFFVSALTEFARNPKREAWERAIIDPQLVSEFIGGYESMPAGPCYHTESWEWEGTPAQSAGMFSTARIGKHAVFVLYYNLGDTSQAYFMQRVEPVSVRNGTLKYDIRYVLREIP